MVNVWGQHGKGLLCSEQNHKIPLSPSLWGLLVTQTVCVFTLWLKQNKNVFFLINQWGFPSMKLSLNRVFPQ